MSLGTRINPAAGGSLVRGVPHHLEVTCEVNTPLAESVVSGTANSFTFAMDLVDP
jgi:hypothetical protein